VPRGGAIERGGRHHYHRRIDAVGGFDVSAALCCRSDNDDDVGGSRVCIGSGRTGPKTANDCARYQHSRNASDAC
jgi:hypothetical protein